MPHSNALSDQQVELLLIIADTFLQEPNIDSIEPLLAPEFPKEKIRDYVESYLLPSLLPHYRENLLAAVKQIDSANFNLLSLLLKALNTPILSSFVTGSPFRFRNMSIKQRELVLRCWRDSLLPSCRRIFMSLYQVTVPVYCRMSTDLHNLAIGYVGRDERGFASLLPDYKMLEMPLEGDSDFGRFDVLIIGSGCGAGVVAHTLSRSGFRALILEKGTYYPPSEFKFNDEQGYEKLFENEAVIALTGGVSILAGSTFGGGSTVNWLASLRTPRKVRHQWATQHGIDWADSNAYDECMEYVWETMGVVDTNILHSFLNRVILNGAKKLDYKHAIVAQNNGNSSSHPCKMCHLGCRSQTKQGSAACWFKDIGKSGSQFMDQIRVLQILHHDGVAIGALCQDNRTGREFKMTGFKKVVVSAGALNSPLLLQRSGFKNRHIGRNLKLHPCTSLFGFFENKDDERPYDYPILTSVCAEADNLDGNGHGARVETMLHAPFITLVFLPWNLSDTLRSDLAKYRKCSSMLAIARDTSSGTIRNDCKTSGKMKIDYKLNDFDLRSLHEAMLVASDLMYIEGVQEILLPQMRMPRFKSFSPKEDRDLTDADYLEWRKKIEKTPLARFSSAFGSAHQMSSCRMSGKGPKDGACDTKGRLYECENIYVADSSVMPTASGVNPMVTTMALSRKIAAGIVKDLMESHIMTGKSE